MARGDGERAEAGSRPAGCRMGVLVACYGTSDPARAAEVSEAPLRAVREALCAAYGFARDEVACCAAFTSPKVRCALAAAGADAPSVADALIRLRAAGASEVVVASTHLVGGESYRRLGEAVRAASPGRPVKVSAPVLYDIDDVRELAAALAARYPVEPGRAVVLVGHGAEGPGQFAYLALESSLRAMGRGDVLLGTLRGRPGFDEVARALARTGSRRVLIVPLMMAPGVHAERDLAGAGERSWTSRLAARGLEVEVAREGLAALSEVQAIVSRHALDALGSDGAPTGPAAAPAPGARTPGHGRFPLFVDLAGADCLVVGAGAVGSRRARALARFGARVTVVDPRGWGGAGPDPVGAAACPGAIVLERGYEPGDERGRRLVVAATSDRATNRGIGARCRAAGIPVSVADAADECTFAFPALAEADGLVCGIVSTDNDHARVARAARAVRAALGPAPRSMEGR